MKSYLLIAPLCVALLSGCVYRPIAYTPAPASIAYASPAYVGPYTVVAP